MGVIERIHAIQQGIDARNVGLLAKSMRRSKDRVAEMLGMSVTTIDRKAKQGDLLSQEQSERLFGAAKLIGQVQTMVEESGDPQGFDAAQWFAEWLDTPLKALSGKPPACFMDTAEGRDLLSKLLATAQSGAYV
ncbi:hypothetical protein CR159_09395 [Pollutimonas subterranea]|uniref:Toxin-antitoxin system antitoxin component, TIGR02293 family n=2 Tax=Pollutimonas subterranea TaxID=2045210 RepID=A0A2N4U5H3_9BURK|nr:hypothetical protein CR159_09395 [Pollutimonas subterranea]